MAVEIKINGTGQPSGRYVSWSPSPCEVRMVGSPTSTDVELVCRPSVGGGEFVFHAAEGMLAESTLTLTLPQDGTPARFYIAGKFGAASKADRDTSLEVLSGAAVIASIPLMVRVRKDANLLVDAERDRFIAAFAAFDDHGAGRFREFRDMHTDESVGEAHGDRGFLPWHRAYLLDLERELQAIDSSVALPFWRFDRPAPKLFQKTYLGESDSNGVVHFDATNPLGFWTTDGVLGIVRKPYFDPVTGKAFVLSQADTLLLGDPGALYARFAGMEGNPHGFAHGSFGGSLASIGTAAKDPLFFLLHCNVDRLWALWQWFHGRFDPTEPKAFDAQGAAGAVGARRIGHNADDAMWPWNGASAPPRPSTAPGGRFSAGVVAAAPGPMPVVRSMLDPQGRFATSTRAGFDYEDVPFDAWNEIRS